jgi:multidrug efflux pump subunit AcrA (membrane-fusion protein)
LLVVWVARKDFNAQIAKSPRVARTLGYSVTVQVAEAKTEQITDVIGATGAIEAIVTVRLRALVSDKILQLGADLGDWVKPGQVLARIAPTVFQAAVNEAKNLVTRARNELAKTQETVKTQLEELKAILATAEDNVKKTTTDLRNAQLQFDRFSVLYDQKVIAKVELEAAEARLSAAKAALSTAQQDLVKVQNDLKNYTVTTQAALAAARAAVTTALDLLARNERDFKNTVLLCPVEGIVLQRLKQVGETPGPAEEVFVVGTLDSIYMVARVAEEYVSKVRLGGKAETVFDAFPNEKIPGTIAKIDPTTDIKTRTFPVYVKIDNMQRRFKPGLTGFTRIDWRRTALTVPRLAVVRNAEEAAVFVVENGAARIRPVKVLNAPGSKLEVVTGLRDGDRVIYYPVLKIKDNDPVRIGDGGGVAAKTGGSAAGPNGAVTR